MSALFTNQELPRSPRIRRMHVIDAGTDKAHVHMVCVHCGHDDGFNYYHGKTLTELKRGLPCPKCNMAEPQKDTTHEQ